MEISGRIKAARTEKGISLSELSEKTNIAKSTLQRYETGSTSKIPMVAVSKIETALNIPRGKLMGWIKDEPIAVTKSTSARKIQVHDNLFNSEKFENLIKIFEKLSENGKDKVIDYANMVYASEQHNK